MWILVRELSSPTVDASTTIRSPVPLASRPDVRSSASWGIPQRQARGSNFDDCFSSCPGSWWSQAAPEGPVRERNYRTPSTWNQEIVPLKGLVRSQVRTIAGHLWQKWLKPIPGVANVVTPDAKLTVWAGDGAKHSHRMSQESSKLPTAGPMKSLKPFREWKIRSYIGSLSSQHQRRELCLKQQRETMTACFPLDPRGGGMGWWKIFSDRSLSWDCLQILPCLLCRLLLLCSLFLACLFI